ncbi:hypothetical protein ACHQM5_026843 [Ranunculus cassubicifolius]
MTDNVINVALALILAFTMYECFIIINASHILSKVHVEVHNSIAPDKNMNVHCRSKDNNLGDHTVIYGQYYTWDFHVNFWGTTLFWCSVDWIDNQGIYVHGSFKIYDFNRDALKCDKMCVWSAQQDGVYFISPEVNHIPELMFPWTKSAHRISN